MSPLLDHLSEAPAVVGGFTVVVGGMVAAWTKAYKITKTLDDKADGKDLAAVRSQCALCANAHSDACTRRHAEAERALRETSSELERKLDALRQQVLEGRREMERTIHDALQQKADVQELATIRGHLAETREEVASLKALVAARFDALENLLRHFEERR
jgi:chromosome segregation ATPase